MFASSCIPFWTMLAGWAQVAVLIVTARFVWRYLQETERLRKIGQEQLEGQIRPAIAVQPGGVRLVLLNIGKGPALHIKLSATERGSAGKRDLDRMDDEIGFLQPGGPSLSTSIRTQGAGINVLSGRSLQCEYTSLSGRTYWTVADFDKFDNDRLIATRFTSDSK